MRFLALLVGAALLAGELARRGDSLLQQPRALDDLVAGMLLLGLGLAGARARPALHAAGWGLFTGVMLTTFGLTLDAALNDPAKPRAGAYAALLAALVALGTAAALWWARRR